MHKVLLVEDEKILRKGLSFMIDWVSLQCSPPIEAANGKEGLELIEKLRPDIVLTDVKMPLMNGIEMLEKGLAIYHFESAIISGYDEFSYAQTAIKLGVSDYLMKPVQEDELKKTIARLCHLSKTHIFLNRVEGKIQSSRAESNADLLEEEIIERRLKTSSKYVSYMLKKIRDGYSGKLYLKLIAEELGISDVYLNQIFKQETGYTFNDFLNRYRIQTAIGLLLQDKYKVYEVAQMTGFGEYRYFAQVFKKYVSKSPTAFCEINREEDVLWENKMDEREPPK